MDPHLRRAGPKAGAFGYSMARTKRCNGASGFRLFAAMRLVLRPYAASPVMSTIAFPDAVLER